MSCRLIIVGAGGMGRDALEFALDCQREGLDFTIGGFLDDNADALREYDLGFDVIGDLQYQPQANDGFIIAVGEPHMRAQWRDSLQSRGARFINLIHPKAFVASNAQIGEGCLIAPMAFIGASCRIEDNVLVNVGAVVGHDAHIGQHTVICPGASASGFTTLGERVFMGTNAVVVPGKKIGRESQVTAGSVVYNNVGEGEMALGNPARGRKVPRRES